MKQPDVAPDISYIPDEKNPSNCVSFLFFINQLKVDLCMALGMKVKFFAISGCSSCNAMVWRIYRLSH